MFACLRTHTQREEQHVAHYYNLDAFKCKRKFVQILLISCVLHSHTKHNTLKYTTVSPVGWNGFNKGFVDVFSCMFWSFFFSLCCGCVLLKLTNYFTTSYGLVDHWVEGYEGNATFYKNGNPNVFIFVTGRHQEEPHRALCATNDDHWRKGDDINTTLSSSCQ